MAMNAETSHVTLICWVALLQLDPKISSCIDVDELDI
jgi:hypothetical protein